MSTPITASAHSQTVGHGAKARLPMIDTAKGVGILLIVLIHNTLFGENFPTYLNALMAFIVPFFFFMSGVTLSLGDRDLRRIIIERTDALLKPCAVVVIVFGFFKAARGSASIESVFVGLSIATGYTLAWTPMWFIPLLWLASVSASFLLIRCSALFQSKIAIGLLLLSCIVAGCWLLQLYSGAHSNDACIKQFSFSMQLFECGLPFSADLLPITLFFFFVGYLLSSRVKAFQPTLILGAAALGLLVLLRFCYPEKLDLNLRIYDHLVMTPIQAITGIYLLLWICYFISKDARAAIFFGYFGRMSLFILIFHAPVQYILLRTLARWSISDALVGLTAYVSSIAISVAIYHIIKATPYVSKLMLPLRHTPRQLADL